MERETDLAEIVCRPVRQLGKGGMAVVFEAVEEATGERRALKVFAAEGPRAGFLRGRFLAEGRLLSGLDHPRLVKVRGYGVGDAPDSAYIVMDLVLGADGNPHTLSDLHAAHEITEEKLFGWYADLSSALAYIHGHGVVHRDVKPSNVLIDSEGRAVLADFGVSRYGDEALRKSLSVEPTMATDATTLSKVVLGTANYIAPEVRRGEPATPASDMYALGVTLFRLLTGVWYEPDTNALDLLEPFDPAWRGVFEALLATDPARRSLAVPRRRRRRLRLPPHAVVAAAGAALTVAALAAVLFAALSSRRGRVRAAAAAEPPPPPPAAAPAAPATLFDERLGPYDAESAAVVAKLKSIPVEEFEIDQDDKTDDVFTGLVKENAAENGLNMQFHGGQTGFATVAVLANTTLFDVLDIATGSVRNSSGTWWVEKGVVHICAFPVMEERVYEIELDAAAKAFFAEGYLERLGDNYKIYYSTTSALFRLEYREENGVGVLAVRDRRRDIEKVVRILSDNRLRFRYARRKVFLEIPE